MTSRLVIGSVICSVLLAGFLAGQTPQSTPSLGDLGRKARAARNDAAAGKTYNNDALNTSPAPAVPPMPPADSAVPGPGSADAPREARSPAVNSAFAVVNQPPGAYTLTLDSRRESGCSAFAYNVSGKYPAHTESHLKYVSTANAAPSAGGWTYTAKVSAQVSPAVTMPAWVNMPDDPAYRTAWTRMYDALLRHEQGHVNIGYEAARQMNGRVVVGKGVTQDDARQDAARQLKETMDQFEAKDRAYDTLTNHGAAQSAVGGTDVPSNCPPGRR